MALLRLIIYVVAILVFILVGLVIVLRNDTPVLVDLLIIQFTSLGVGSWIFLSLIVGILLGWMSLLPAGILLKLSNKNNQKKLKSQAVELSRLRGLPVKGN